MTAYNSDGYEDDLRLGVEAAVIVNNSSFQNCNVDLLYRPKGKKNKAKQKPFF